MIPENQLDLFIGLLSTEQSTLSSKLGDSNNDAKAVLSELKDINAVLTLLYRLSEKLKKSPSKDSNAPAKEASKKKRSK